MSGIDHSNVLGLGYGEEDWDCNLRRRAGSLAIENEAQKDVDRQTYPSDEEIVRMVRNGKPTPRKVVEDV